MASAPDYSKIYGMYGRGAEGSGLFSIPEEYWTGSHDTKWLEGQTGQTLGSKFTINPLSHQLGEAGDTYTNPIYGAYGLDPNKQYVSGQFRSLNPEDNKYGYQNAIWEKQGNQYVPFTVSEAYRREGTKDAWTDWAKGVAFVAAALGGGALALNAAVGAGAAAGAGGAAEAGGAAATGGGGGSLTGTGGYGLTAGGSGTTLGTAGSGVSLSGAGAATGSGLGATTGAGTTLAATTGTGMGLSEGLAAGLYGGSGWGQALDYAKQAYDYYGKAKKVQNAFNTVRGLSGGAPEGGGGGGGGQGMAGMVSAAPSGRGADLRGLLGNPQLGAAAAQERQFLNQSYAPIAREQQRRGLARGLADEWNV